MSNIIALVSSKGGVGKTTTAINVAAVYAHRGSRVVLLDVDEAGHAVAVAALGALAYPVQPLPLETDSDADIKAWGRSVRRAATEHDVVVIDSPGARAAAYGATLAIADMVVIPVATGLLDLRGAAETVAAIRRQRQRVASPRPRALVLPSRVDRRTVSGRDLPEALAGLGEVVASPITARSIVVDALAIGESVPLGTPAAAEYDALVSHIGSMLEDR